MHSRSPQRKKRPSETEASAWVPVNCLVYAFRHVHATVCTVKGWARQSIPLVAWHIMSSGNSPEEWDDQITSSLLLLPTYPFETREFCVFFSFSWLLPLLSLFACCPCNHCGVYLWIYCLWFHYHSLPHPLYTTYPFSILPNSPARKSIPMPAIPRHHSLSFTPKVCAHSLCARPAMSPLPYPSVLIFGSLCWIGPMEIYLVW